MYCSRIHRICFLIALPAITPAAVVRVNALLIAAATDASIRHAGTATFIRVEAGAELIDGDTLRSGSQPSYLLTCADSNGGPVDATYSFPPKIEARFTGAVTQENASPAAVEPSPCTLPIDDRSLHADLDDPRVRDGLQGTWERRLRLLSDAGSRRLTELLGPVEEQLKVDPKNLRALVARARYLESAGLAADSLRAYLEIFRLYPQAAWAARSASRMTAQLLPEPDIQTALIPPEAEPINHPRRAGGGEVSTLAGVIAPQGEIYALLIGIATYPPSIGVDNLQYSEADADLFRKYLDSARGGQAKHVKILKSSDATASAIRDGLEELVKGHAGAGNTLVIFVAAHGYYGCVDEHGVPSKPGCPDVQKEPFILTVDTSGEAARSTGLPMREFERMVTQNAYRFGRVLVYVDVCHSGVIPWLHERTAPPPDAVQKNFEPQIGAVGLMMASFQNPNSKDLEYAYESDRLHHGIFTYYLLSGLAGTVAPQSNYVLFRDLSKEVQEQVSAATGNKQIPSDRPIGQQLAVVDNAALHDFSVPPPDPNAGPLIRPLPKHRDPYASPLPAEDHSRSGEAHLSGAAQRVALENAGRQVILTYLQGDQVPQKRADFERGANLFEAALQLAPGTATNQSQMLFCRGRVAIFDKRYGEAREAMESSIRLDPSHGYAYNGLGIALLEQLPDHPDYLQAAVDAFEDAHRLEPFWAYPLHNLALAYSQRGDDTRAIETYREAMRIAPAYSYLPYNLGLLHERRNEMDLAERSFQLALKRAEVRGERLGIPAGSWVEAAAPLNALSTVYLSEGRLRAAAKQLDLALRADPGYVPALHNKAILLARRGRRQEAILVWRSALALDPEFLPARLSLAEAFAKARDFDHAALEYREILDRKPSYPAAQRAWALMLASMEKGR